MPIFEWKMKKKKKKTLVAIRRQLLSASRSFNGLVKLACNLFILISNI